MTNRNNTITSVAMSPSIASSPIRSTFPDLKITGRATPPATDGRPTVSKGRQNSTQSSMENGIRQASPAPNKQNRSGTGTPDFSAVSHLVGRSIPEVKASMRESATNSKEHLLEDIDQEDTGLIGGIVVGNRTDVLKREALENSVEPIIQISTITTTKSGRASKPSTPAIPQFPEPVRSRSSRNVLEAASNNKRSHKKGAGAAAQQQLMAQQRGDDDEASSVQEGDDEDEEIGPDEPRYCYCNGVSYGEMVGCDGESCLREWFHLECVGLEKAPNSKGKSAIVPLSLLRAYADTSDSEMVLQ